MLFPTPEFALFFCVVFCASWAAIARPQTRKLILLGASYFFYGYWDWRFMGLLAFSSTVNYLAGRIIADTSAPNLRRRTLIAAIAINLLVLAAFKYAGFFMTSLGDALALAGLERDLPLLQIVLPVGISFFTFQGISYVVDVYREETPAVRSPVDLFLYISFFPQLVAGPIVRAAWFLPQLEQAPKLTRAALCLGLTLILLGLFKKMVIANYLATELVDTVFIDPSGYSSLDLLVAIYGYAIQIYCDFSGYSDIAIGVAALLGYSFHRNFDQPYRASSLQDFWRRWHISLSQWLRDYLYKPLGGSRLGRSKTYRNLAITMLLGGIWHGAAWTFIAWGAIHAAVLAAERALRRVPQSLETAQARKWPHFIVNAGKIALTFHIVCLSWIFFRAEDFATAFTYLHQLLTLSTEVIATTPFLAALVIASLAAQFLPVHSVERLSARLESLHVVLLAAGFAISLLAIDLVAPEGMAPFIYFQF